MAFDCAGSMYIKKDTDIEPHSPSGFSVGSSVSSGDRLSFGPSTITNGTSSNASRMQGMETPHNQIARSVHVTDGETLANSLTSMLFLMA